MQSKNQNQKFMPTQIDLTIIIPAYNEEDRIAPTLSSYLNYFEKLLTDRFEVIVVLNGCRDNTLNIVKSFQKDYPQVKFINCLAPIGKGGAIARGMQIAKGEFVGYSDADGSTNAQCFDKLYQTIHNFRSHCDCVIGSRNLANSIVSGKPQLRTIMSLGFRTGVNLLLKLNIKDSQCGAKLITRKALQEILPELVTGNLAFDVNLLLLLKRHKMHIMEMPIIWKDEQGSKIGHPLKTSIVMAFSVIRLWLMYLPFANLYQLLQPLGSQVWKLILTAEQIENRKIKLVDELME